MQILTYTNGILTVIREDEFFSKEFTKPAFITGTNFYYEPTLKQMDGVELTASEIEAVQKYITEFDFVIVLEAVQTIEEIPVHCVDANGEYKGFKLLEDGETEVGSAPMDEYAYTWSFETNSWYKSILVNKVDGSIIGNGKLSLIANSVYIPEVLVDLDICTMCQTYDFTTKQVTVNLESAKEKRILSIQQQVKPKLEEALSSKLVLGEFNYWAEQEAEARLYIADNSIVTPMLDSLFMARGTLEANKLELAQKIIAKADAYKIIYGNVVGTSHKLIAQINSVTTVAELKSIVW